MSDFPEDLTGLEFVAVLEALANGVTVVATDGRIKYFNEAARRILGLPATDAPPSEWSAYYGILKPETGEPFPEEEYPILRALAGEEPHDVELLIRNPTLPEPVIIAASARALRDEHGVITGAVAIFRDVTELKEALSSLERTNARLAEAQRMREELNAFVVHDLKNPIQAIIGLAELLEEPEAMDLEQIRTDAVHIRLSAERLHGMVLDLLDVQLAQDGRLEVRPEPVRLERLFAEVVDTLRTRSPGLVAAPVAPGLTVRADRSLLFRLLANLVDNCTKYGPPDGSIVLQAMRDGDGLARVVVQDEGPGVPAGLKERIFEKYAQLERDRVDRARTSRGLGLWFCHVVAEAHGGRIWVEDAEPVGARFCVTLPLT